MPSLSILINRFNVAGYTVDIIDGANVPTSLDQSNFAPAGAAAINPGDELATIANFTPAPKWQATLSIVPGIAGSATARFKIDSSILPAPPYLLKADVQNRTDPETFS